MRRRKHLTPLTLDNLRAHMAPGRSYTSAMLACIFDGSPAAIAEMLETLTARGETRSAPSNCGRKLDYRPDRRRYWLTPPKRLTPTERGELRGYDLMRFPRLAMASRR